MSTGLDGCEESITRVLLVTNELGWWTGKLEFAYTHTDKFSEANVYIFCVAPLARAVHKANEMYQISVRRVPCVHNTRIQKVKRWRLEQSAAKY
jgi:hypothetical protein